MSTSTEIDRVIKGFYCIFSGTHNWYVHLQLDCEARYDLSLWIQNLSNVSALLQQCCNILVTYNINSNDLNAVYRESICPYIGLGHVVWDFLFTLRQGPSHTLKICGLVLKMVFYIRQSVTYIHFGWCRKTPYEWYKIKEISVGSIRTALLKIQQRTFRKQRRIW